MKKMRIAIDARILSTRLTGIGRYTYEVLANLDRHDLDIDIYTSTSPVLPRFSYANVCVFESGIKSRFFSQLWAQFILPILVNKSNACIFWSPSHRIPFLLSRRIKSVVTIHDLVWLHEPKTMRKFSRILDKWLMPYAIYRADKIITVSQSTANDVVEFSNSAASKISVTPLAPFPIVGAEDSKLKLPNDYVLMVGTIEPRKNIERALIAYSMLPESLRRKYNLIIVGNKGWGDVRLNDIVSEYSLGGFVRHHEGVSDLDLQAYYKNSYCLLMPSLYEGFGLPIVEAMRYSKPAIVSEISSMPEVVGNAGLLIDPQSVGSIHQALYLLLTDFKLYKSLQNECAIRITKFSWMDTANKTLAVFNSIV